MVRPSQATPTAPLHTPAGGVTTLSRYRGTVALVNIWATWCPACLYELPSLARLQARLGRDRVRVVLVSVDSGGWDVVRPYLDRLGVQDLDHYLDPVGRLAEALGVHEGLPWTFVMDPAGRIVGYVAGAAEWDGKAARELIDHYASHVPPQARP